ncbi:MAG: hemerythrin domain-containing protein [Bacteroidota bacterium]|nr:hemerythrin domain-containing protein [Bacteroidota bacterium]
METTSQDLKHEHDAIQIALNIIEKMYQNIREDKEIDRRDIKEILEFLKVFADKCHHGKEEAYLFPALERAGIPNRNGPIEKMLEQHRQGRELIRKMDSAINGRIIDRKAYIEAASAYVELLRNHIEKENNILFPMSDAKLSKEKQKELLSDFERLEKNVIGAGVHEELHALLKRLSRKYLS